MNADQTVIEQTVEPKAGRVVIFTSGKENPHVVDRVLSGNRFVLAFWFTCNPARKFENFLDGKEHSTFSLNFADSLKQKERQEKRRILEENKALRDKENEEKGLDEL